MDTHWPLLQVGLCFAGEMVLFVKSCSVGLSPLYLQASPFHSHSSPLSLASAFCLHLGQG